MGRTLDWESQYLAWSRQMDPQGPTDFYSVRRQGSDSVIILSSCVTLDKLLSFSEPWVHQ